MIQKNKKVLYRHVRLDKNEVFYVGIGNPKRPYDRYFRNNWWKNIVAKTDYKIDILFDDLTWEEACEKEKEFISLYGRRDLGKGPLVNLTDGGDSIKGYVMTQEHKNKISKANKGNTYRLSEETKRRIGKAAKGRKHSKETKDKLKKLAKGRNSKAILQFDLSGNFIKEWESSVALERELGLSRSSLRRRLNGKFKEYRGYKWKWKK